MRNDISNEECVSINDKSENNLNSNSHKDNENHSKYYSFEAMKNTFPDNNSKAKNENNIILNLEEKNFNINSNFNLNNINSNSNNKNIIENNSNLNNRERTSEDLNWIRESLGKKSLIEESMIENVFDPEQIDIESQKTLKNEKKNIDNSQKSNNKYLEEKYNLQKSSEMNIISDSSKKKNAISKIFIVDIDLSDGKNNKKTNNINNKNKDEGTKYKIPNYRKGSISDKKVLDYQNKNTFITPNKDSKINIQIKDSKAFVNNNNLMIFSPTKKTVSKLDVSSSNLNINEINIKKELKINLSSNYYAKLKKLYNKDNINNKTLNYSKNNKSSIVSLNKSEDNQMKITSYVRNASALFKNKINRNSSTTNNSINTSNLNITNQNDLEKSYGNKYYVKNSIENKAYNKLTNQIRKSNNAISENTISKENVQSTYSKLLNKNFSLEKKYKELREKISKNIFSKKYEKIAINEISKKSSMKNLKKIEVFKKENEKKSLDLSNKKDVIDIIKQSNKKLYGNFTSDSKSKNINNIEDKSKSKYKFNNIYIKKSNDTSNQKNPINIYNINGNKKIRETSEIKRNITSSNHKYEKNILYNNLVKNVELSISPKKRILENEIKSNSLIKLNLKKDSVNLNNSTNNK